MHPCAAPRRPPSPRRALAADATRRASRQVDAEELSDALRTMGWATNPTQAQRMIASVDTEGKGSLSFAQVCAKKAVPRDTSLSLADAPPVLRLSQPL